MALNGSGQMFAGFRLILGALIAFFILIIIFGALTQFERIKSEIAFDALTSGLNSAKASPNGDIIKKPNIFFSEATFTKRFFFLKSGVKEECLELVVEESPLIHLLDEETIKIEGQLYSDAFFSCALCSPPALKICRQCQMLCWVSLGKDLKEVEVTALPYLKTRERKTVEKPVEEILSPEQAFLASIAQLFETIFGAQGLMAVALESLELLGPGLIVLVLLLGLVCGYINFRYSKALFKKEVVSSREEKIRLMERVILAVIAFSLPAGISVLTKFSLGLIAGIIEAGLLYAFYFFLKYYKKKKWEKEFKLKVEVE